MVSLVRIRLQHKAVVRTLHDVAPYERLSPLQRLSIALLDRWTTLWITLSDATQPLRPGSSSLVAPIGHYRDWFAGRPRAASRPGRIVHFGLLRRYKGVDTLLAAFAGMPDDGPDCPTLRIIGYPQDGQTVAAIDDACRSDHRISAVTEYVPDDDLVREVTESELVVLPFDRLTNSSSLILALSLDRPVLVPSTPITEEVAAEVGPGWVLTYQGALGTDDICRALAAVRRASSNPTAPDLSRRDWDVVCAQHAAAFTRAVALRRHRHRHRPPP
jgi:beta-1,4-mannosyltransferase